MVNLCFLLIHLEKKGFSNIMISSCCLGKHNTMRGINYHILEMANLPRLINSEIPNVGTVEYIVCLVCL